VVFIPRTAPGDRVLIRIEQERERWARGSLVELLEAGEGRRKAPCPRYDECDGCALQHVEEEIQLQWKGRIVGDALRRIGGFPVPDPAVEPSPRSLQYRNKVTMTLRRLAGGRVVAGLRKAGDRGKILDLGTECLLLAPELATLWGEVKAAWGPGARHLPGGGELRLTLRQGDEGGTLLVRGGKGDGDPRGLLGGTPSLKSVWREDRDGGVRLVAGEESLPVSWLGEVLRLHGGAFLQVNPEAGEALHRFVLDRTGEVSGRTVLDAYCGVGVLGRILARRGGRVVGIEADPLGVAEARRDAPDGLSVELGRVEDLLRAHLPADLVILNPPRGGVDARVSGALATEPSDRLIYVSCDPATLARDLSRLGGVYEVEEMRSFDLFPQTGHVETVVTLQAKRA